MNKYRKALNQIYEDTCYIEGDIIKHNNDEEFEELRELVDKATPFVATNQYFSSNGWNGTCKCGKLVKGEWQHCVHCGQALSFKPIKKESEE
jgi:hypothetical protein